MAAVTICSDFGAQENKVCHCFIFALSVCHEVMGPDAMILIFWMLSFKPAFSLSSFTFSSVPQSYLTLCHPMDCSTPGFPVHHQLPEFTQTHIHWASDAIQQSHPLSSPLTSTFNLSQHQGLFQSVSSLHQVVKVLEFQLQQQSFLWIFRTNFLYDGLISLQSKGLSRVISNTTV